MLDEKLLDVEEAAGLEPFEHVPDEVECLQQNVVCEIAKVCCDGRRARKRYDVPDNAYRPLVDQRFIRFVACLKGV